MSSIADLYKTYKEWIEFSRMQFSVELWVGLTLLISAGVAIIFFGVAFIFTKGTTLFPIACSVSVLIFMLGYPYYRKEKITSDMESIFPECLKQMADILKAGDTYESALREIANSDYGRMSEEMALALRRIEDGENMENSLRAFSQSVDSRLINRTIEIIIDSIKTGASLADVLEEISDDLREVKKIKDERKSSTMMQFIFLLVASAIIVPIIFGEINSIMGMFQKVAKMTATPEKVREAGQIVDFVFMLIQFYILTTVISAGLMMSQIQEGKPNKAVIYVPILTIVAFLIYYAVAFVAGTLFAGF
jgi:flagellar protein FlaJ